MRILTLFPLALAAAACAAPERVPPLSPRAAELIDPRLPVRPEPAPQPPDPALAARLAQLVAQARSGDLAFQAAAAQAERLAAVAGAREGEAWIAAQQALSAAIAAREPTTRALGDIDAIAARELALRGGLVAGDLAAVEAAAEQIAAIDRGQVQRIEALQRRLGG
ncbi:MAG TPA: hypothetical protein VM346_10740 [Sphingomicrobium sp.]|nr:hypothetical protein [Sphingomicrobium sp.]